MYFYCSLSGFIFSLDSLISSPVSTGFWWQRGQDDVRDRGNEAERRAVEFSLFCIAQYHKLRICLKGLYNLYTYDIPDLWPHIRSGKTPKKSTQKKLSQGKKREETFRRATEEDPSPGWTEDRRHVTRRNQLRGTRCLMQTRQAGTCWLSLCLLHPPSEEKATVLTLNERGRRSPLAWCCCASSFVAHSTDLLLPLVFQPPATEWR